MERDSDEDGCLANQFFMEPKKTKAQCQVLNKLGAYREDGFQLLLLIPSVLRFFQLRIFSLELPQNPLKRLSEDQRQDYEATLSCR